MFINWTAIRHFFDKFPSGVDRTSGYNHVYGKWYVEYPPCPEYPEGAQSQNMMHDTALEYAQVYKGKVVHADFRPPKKTKEE